MFEFLTTSDHETPNLDLHCSWRDLHLLVQADDQVTAVHITSSGVTAAPSAPPPGAIDADITLTASLPAWTEFLSDTPGPGFQALSTMRRCGHLLVEGNLLAFNQNLLLLEMLFAKHRADDFEPPSAVGSPFIEEVAGRYLHLDIEGRPHRIYFEEAGSGIPLLCLHTAGADGRQYRSLLNDEAVTSRFRVIAFDLPWHGKSSPPAGFQNEVYSLTTDTYVAITMAFARALNLADTVVMGCSIGGRAVIHLAHRHGEELAAVIGLQSALYAEDKTGNVEDASRMLLHRPDVHGGKIAGALMNGVMAPQSPVSARWETMWHYMQGGPGVFLGDLHYYFRDGDLRDIDLSGLDQDKCPLYLLSGEYDPSATPEMGRELARRTGARHFEVMSGMGHFPMSENPDAFRRYLLPVLNEIADGIAA